MKWRFGCEAGASETIPASRGGAFQAPCPSLHPPLRAHSWLGHPGLFTACGEEGGVVGFAVQTSSSSLRSSTLEVQRSTFLRPPAHLLSTFTFSSPHLLAFMKSVDSYSTIPT